MKTSRRNFLKGLGTIFALPLAGLKPKSADEELPGIVEGLPESSEEQPMVEESIDYADSPYHFTSNNWVRWDATGRGMVFIDGKFSHYDDWNDIRWIGKIEED